MFVVLIEDNFDEKTKKLTQFLKTISYRGLYTN